MRAWRVSGALLLTIWSCGDSYGDDRSDAPPPVDAGASDVEPSREAGAPVETPSGAACAPGAPFIRRSAVEGLNTTAYEASASFTADELYVYLGRGIDGAAADIHFGSRTAFSAPFVNVIGAPELNTAQLDDNPATSADGLVLHFFSARAGTYDLYRAERATLTTPFRTPVPIAELNSAQNDWDPSWVEQTRTLYFLSDRSGRNEIYAASMTGAGFDAPRLEPMPGAFAASVGGTAGQPVASADERELFFAVSGAPDTHVYSAARTTRGEPFGEPRRVTLGSNADLELPLWMSADQCRLYFRTTQPDAGTSADIWVASRR